MSCVSAILLFKQLKPNIIKRALILKDRVVIWASRKPQEVIKHWLSLFGNKYKIRVMPITPLEGGVTQENWNVVWDSSTTIYRGIRSCKIA